MLVYMLITELSGNVIHVGTKAECELILKSFVTYGIREDKFIITDNSTLNEEAI